MAEHTSTRLHKAQQRHRATAVAKIEARWPGGLRAMLDDYANERTTLAAITDKTGVLFRAVRRTLSENGIPLRDPASANKVGHALNPKWGEHISRTKLVQSFRHSPEVTKAATAKRLATFAREPHRIGNANIGMTNRERQFSEFLDAAGIRHQFNQHADRYWLDFHLADLRVGIELQRNCCIPDPVRDATITRCLNLHAMFYIPTWYLRVGLDWYVKEFIQALAESRIDFREIGDARFLCKRRGRCHSFSGGFYFMRRWATIESSTARQNPAPAEVSPED